MPVCMSASANGATFRCQQCALQFLHVKDSAYGCLRQDLIPDWYAAELAQDTADECQTARQAIRGSLAKYGNAICSRWKKKSKDKRAALMLKVHSSMERYAHFEVHANRNRAVPSVRADFDWHEDSIVQARSMPFLNLETLQHDPMRLLSLLHFRSSARLEDWVSSDVSRLEEVCRRVDGRAKFMFNLNCVKMRGPGLGELVPHDQEKCHSLEIVGFPLAYSVLAMQFKLLIFLNAMVNNILDLESTTTTPEGNDRWLALLSCGFKFSGAAECWSQFDNPFSSAPKFDPEQCLQQVKAHLAEAEDHLILAQTSPEYFQSIPGFHIEAASVKYQKSMHSKPIPVHAEGRRVVDLTLTMMEKVANLRWLAKQVAYVAGARQEQDSSYDRALGALYKMANELCQSSKHDLGEMLRGSADFGPSYEISLHHGPGKTMPGIPSKDFKQLFHNDRLHWYLYQIYGLRPNDNSTEESSLFASIEEHLEKADFRERSRVDSNMFMQLSTIAIFQQIKTNIALSFPHLIRCEAEKTFEPELEKINKARRRSPNYHYPSRVGPRSALLELRAHSWPKGRRDQDWLVKSEETRRYMLAFWDAMREEYRRCLVQMGIPGYYADEIISSLKADHAPKHLSEVAVERAQVLQQIAERKGRLAGPGMASSVSVQKVWGEELGGTKFELPVNRYKPKSRPTEIAIHGAADKDAQSIETAVVCPPARIPVTAVSKRILSRLFAAANECAKGIVKWQQIVNALCDAGLIGTNAGGSAVSFRFSSDGGSIVFHKPHPDPNVDLIHQRNMGKRLNKNFGWTAETFVERQKAKEEETTEDWGRQRQRIEGEQCRSAWVADKREACDLRLDTGMLH
ncbi:unnamed protein product [Zymoseptoria tritici ST99CH_3D1]|uniref:Uncharacterized protein n=1 Tax=Zymoseptoria tritici ST99CH_1E4 TaxID=1276532 RepID=A0A2H1FPB4_ZYMTR|nr:unnamed protein product [Zymoseptoria tritici ST99CH_1E4]SMR45333.1 unnamed protein product [Zymoseptoria tritici ST99CH_3D1]